MGRLQGRDRAFALVVPLVLVLVAVYQIGTALLAEQTPWKGGGFGMFATADHVDTRALRVQFVVEGREVGVDLGPLLHEGGPHVGRAHVNVRARPTEHHATHMLRALWGTVWELDDGVARPDIEASAADHLAAEHGPLLVRDDGHLPVERVRLQVWRTTYTRGADEIVPELVRSHDLLVPEERP